MARHQPDPSEDYGAALLSGATDKILEGGNHFSLRPQLRWIEAAMIRQILDLSGCLDAQR